MKALISALRRRRPQPSATSTGDSAADSGPSGKPIRIIVGYAHGGLTDTVARLMRSRLEAALGTQVVVENVPGGGGTTAAAMCAAAAPDGHTLLMAASGEMVIAPCMRDDLPYDAARDLMPVGLVTETPLVIIAGPGAGFSTLQDMVAQSGAHGAPLTYAVPGLGGPHHVTGEWLRHVSGTRLASVAYDGGAPAAADVVRGRVNIGIVALPPALPHTRSGTARPIAITGPRRIDTAPDWPTVAECGYPDFDVSIWIGLMAPANTPAPVVERLNRALNRVLDEQEVREDLAAYGGTPRGGTPEAFASFIQAEAGKYRGIIRSANIDAVSAGAVTIEDAPAQRLSAAPRMTVSPSTESPVKIEFRGVTKRYSAPGSGQGSTLALDRLDVEIKRSEIITVLGPTGCGKSSTLNLIAGFEAPSAGAVLVDREEVTGPAPDRAVVFQQAALFPWLSVFDNITLGVKCRGMARSEYTARAMHLIKEVGLAGFESHYPYQLSGGMQQRVQIARALIAEPQVLLMDEPFGALDSQTRILMQELLLQLWLEHLPTVFFITHDVAEAIFIADRVLLMSKRPGRVKLAVDIRTPKPRTADFLTSPEFVELQRELLHAMHEEFRASKTTHAAQAH